MMQRLNIARGECLRIIVADRSAQRRKRRAERRRRRDGNDESDSGGEEDDSDLSESEPEYDEDLGDDDDDDEEEERRREQAAGYAEFEREQERKFDEMLRGMREEERRVRAEQRKASERAELWSRGFSPWDSSTGGKRGGKKNKKNNKNNKNKAKNQKQQRQQQLRQQEAAAEATRAAQAEKTRNGRRGLVPGEPDACLRDAAYENSADDTACAIRLGLGEGGCHGESIWLSFHPPYSFLSPLPMGGGGRDSSSSSSSSSNPRPCTSQRTTCGAPPWSSSWKIRRSAGPRRCSGRTLGWAAKRPWQRPWIRPSGPAARPPIRAGSSCRAAPRWAARASRHPRPPMAAATATTHRRRRRRRRLSVTHTSHGRTLQGPSRRVRQPLLDRSRRGVVTTAASLPGTLPGGGGRRHCRRAVRNTSSLLPRFPTTTRRDSRPSPAPTRSRWWRDSELEAAARLKV